MEALLDLDAAALEGKIQGCEVPIRPPTSRYFADE
jgi:hypothetical protein